MTRNLISIVVISANLVASAAGGTDAQDASAPSTDHPWLKCADAPTPPIRKGRLRFYPERAQKRGVEGSANVACRFASSGEVIACTWTSEDPTSWGFGEAASKLACQSRVKPEVYRDAPLEGMLVTFTTPIRFKFPPK